MTAVSALNSANFLNAPSSFAGSTTVSSNKSTTQASGAPQSSTMVSIGATNPANPAQTYSFPSTPASDAPPIWQHPPTDAVSSVMANNYLSPSLEDRANGLGSALLNFIKDGGSNFSQSVIQSTPAVQPNSQLNSQPNKPGAVAATSAPAFSKAVGDDTLTIQTKSGVKVEISLQSQGNFLSVEVKSSGDLSDAERGAIAKLSGAFQDALNGLGAATPHLDLSGLTQFDSSVLSSVNLHSEVTPEGQATQTIDFQADSQARTVSVKGPAGTLKVNVDMSNAASWGNATQRAAATYNYLKQFGAAAARGEGDKSLVGMFEDAFSEMNSDYVPPSGLLPATPLTDSDHAMLTGLADFDASVTQSAKPSNPMHLNELDTFSYQVSQNTSIKGNNLNRSISQHQQSHLSASYHAGLVPDVPLELSTLKSSQNYYFNQIDDSADSTIGINYAKGRLTKASLTQSASQSMQTSKYEMDKLIEDTTTPLKKSQTTDILATLKPFLKKGHPAPGPDNYQWQQALSKVHDSILLQADPLSLKSA